MVCIAAFIILLIIWLFTPALKLLGFKKQAKSINQMFKKSMHCFSRRVTLRACDSNFKDEIKNSILRKVIVKHKKWVKPVSWAIEAVAGLIVLVTVWSVLTVIKSALALFVFGTCDIQRPASCALKSTEACSIDGGNTESPIVSWFTDWGQIFSAMPAKFRSWNAQDYVVKNSTYRGEFSNEVSKDASVAVDIFDPGCIVCRRTFINQKNSGFFKTHKTYLLPYPIPGKFKNSDFIAKYIEAVRGIQPENGEKISAEWMIVEKIFIEKDEKGILFQEKFNGENQTATTTEETEKILQGWLKNAGYSDSQIEEISKKAKSEEISNRVKENLRIVNDEIKTKSIPTLIYENQRHEGLYKASK